MAEADMRCATMASICPQVKSAKLRALAATGARRSPAAPALPTISESGVPGYEANAWFATFVAAVSTSPEYQQGKLPEEPH
jgi:tripartite-type tricarboxylate transporter receptor subunit TctC